MFEMQRINNTYKPKQTYVRTGVYIKQCNKVHMFTLYDRYILLEFNPYPVHGFTGYYPWTKEISTK